ncbi:MAG: 3-methyladenine DNA glycosylase [Ignavibacteriales bacterium]|nr:3-methyladenine DNA glycosylase [Ignavibacteriales bacterium]
MKLGDHMNTSRFIIQTPAKFNFWLTVYSHGWCSLPPFRVDKENKRFSQLLQLGDGALAYCTLVDGSSSLSVEVQSAKRLTPKQQSEVKFKIKQCLRMEEDLDEFYTEAKRYSHYRWIPKIGAGRLLRAPTVFEDVVKMMCTTNCSWALTEIMIKNLTTLIGEKFGDDASAFPTPEALAGVSEKFVRKNIRAGYRSPYLIEFAERVASGKLDLESWRTSTLPTVELFKEVRSVKGIGEYAAGNLLRLLGRYDYLALDSWVRGKYFELHKNGRRVSDRTIEKHYADFGKWRGLFFWLEMTKYWYEQQFPF